MLSVFVLPFLFPVDRWMHKILYAVMDMGLRSYSALSVADLPPFTIKLLYAFQFFLSIK